jgi:hypothetical protein
MTSENNALVIDSHRASILHFALTAAIETTQAQLKLKGAQPFADAIALQISAYRAERSKLEEAFPILKPEPAKS